jgi:hypothetical protein
MRPSNPYQFSISRAVTPLVALIWLAGCESDVPRTEPEGGFQAFAIAINSDSLPAFWETVSAENQAQFATALARLQDMPRLISRFQPAEQEQYRALAGITAIENLQTPYDLFTLLMTDLPLCRGERCLQGMTVSEVEPISDDAVQIRTSADQLYTVVRGDDAIWRVHAPVDDLFARSLQDIHNSCDNMRASAEFFGTGVDELTELRDLGFLPTEEEPLDSDGPAASDEPGSPTENRP